MNNLLENLNPEQLKAVLHKDGPLLIVAGAGTGKTTVITRRFAYLIEQRLAGNEEILALTFTEKAAAEMADRVGSLLPLGYFDLWIMTFHGLAERLLKEHGLAIGLPTDFKLLNEFEQWALVKKNLAKFELDYYRPLGNPTKFIHALLKHFSRAKDEDIGPRQYLEYSEELQENFDEKLSGAKGKRRGNFQFPISNFQTNTKYKIQNTAMTDPQEIARLNEIANAYHIYQQLLLDNNSLDFGDLINYALKLFRQRPAILEKYRKQFKYIIVDEFQDTNWSQYELIKLLAAPVNNLAVGGDDDQAIYRFRGASMSNILQFKKDFPASREIILTKNYRSRQNILDLSYEFIKQNNPNRLEWQMQNQNLSVIASDRMEPRLPDGQGSNPADSEFNQRLPRRPDYGTPRNDKDGTNILSKKLVAENKGEGVIEAMRGADLEAEVKSVADKICALKESDKNATWNDFAVLVRANDSANSFIAEFERRGLPFIFGASRGLYAKPLIMDATAYFKLLDNYHESLALYRILNLPMFDFTYEELINFNHLAGKKAWSLYEVITNSRALKFAADLEKKIKPVLSLIVKHSLLARDRPSSEVLLAFMNDSGYLKYLAGQDNFCHLERSERSIIDDKRVKPRIIDSSLPVVAQNDKRIIIEQKSREAVNLLNQFIKRLKTFESASDDKSVKAFLTELNLEMEAGETGSLALDLDAGPEAIRILTAHGAKGLEFSHVFIANLVDKRFPAIERGEAIVLPDALIKEILPEGDSHLEEERRLFYVAMTRAKQGLYFSWAEDYGGKIKKKPSRFLHELGLVEKVPLSNGDKEGLKLAEEKDKSPLPPRLVFDSSKRAFAKGGEMPAHFSYSQLAAYSNCPFQYRLAHILKIPTIGKEQFSFGKTMHSVLQKLFILINEKKGLGQAELFGAMDKSPLPPRLVFDSSKRAFIKGGNISFDEIIKLYEESWVDDWFESKQKKQERRRQGLEILKVFYEKHKTGWPEALFLEKGFNFRITDGRESYIIRGVVDRIDKVDGGLKLIDYKTGQPKDKLSFSDKEQLLIYQLAIQELFREEIKALAFYYLDNNSEVEFIGSAKDLEKIKAKIINTINEIKQGCFKAKPGMICAWCDFKEICQYRA